MNQALIVVDAQNEFSATGLRPVPNHASALAAILEHVAAARAERRPVAWVQHHNKPTESRAFVPDSWGAAFSPGLGPQAGHGPEEIFQKDVYGAFTGTGLEDWLRANRVQSVLIVGFYAHMCLSTSAREALVRGFEVFVDPNATGARDLEDETLGRQTADEVRRSALLHLKNMGVAVAAGANLLSRSASTSSREHSPATDTEGMANVDSYDARVLQVSVWTVREPAATRPHASDRDVEATH